MNVETTINSLKQFCKTNSGDPKIWTGNSGVYQWKLGKETDKGVMNGVVRKLAGIDVSGTQIWVVAGSLKINPDGNILRFTGLSKKQFKIIESASSESQNVEDVTLS